MFFVFGNVTINFLSKLQKDGQPIRKDGPESLIIKKAGTPTMGGVIILAVVLVSTILWSRWDNKYVWVILFVTFSFGLIGLIDDYIKVVKRNTKGFSSRLRLFLGFSFALIAAYFIQVEHSDTLSKTLALPIFKDHLIFIGVVFFPFAMIVIAGSANAVNLTDGLDGLAIMPVVMVAAGLGVFAYLSGDIRFANYLHIPYVKYTSELVVICSAMIGAGLAFLWYNAHPAQVFMGDVGALALGAMLGTIAVMVRQEIVFAIMGGVFVMEAVSVFLQIGSLRMRNKRVFLMAPLHHHYEKQGWKETQVVIRFWIITIFLVVLGLMTLKLR